MAYVQIVKCEVPAYGKGYKVIDGDTGDNIWNIIFPTIASARRDAEKCNHVITSECEPWPPEPTDDFDYDWNNG